MPPTCQLTAAAQSIRPPASTSACDDSRPRGASGDGGARDGKGRFSEAYGAAGLPRGLGCAPRHLATPGSETCKMGARRGSRTGNSASSRKASPLSLTEADKPGVGPLAWPARRPHGPLRSAWFPVRPRSAMASASPNRIVKRMRKTGFGLGQPATLGLRLSRFRDFLVSGDRLARGMACRGCPPADADAHGRRPSGRTFRRASRQCCSQW
jgi:hypothetical protein